MSQTEHFAAFTDAVVRRVRCRLVRAPIAAELTAHLEDHAAALRAGGSSWDEAERLAVEAMGDPVEVGEGLDRLYPPVLYRLVRMLAWAAAVLLLTVVVMAGLRDFPQDWYGYELFPRDELTQELAAYDDRSGAVWTEELVATGYVLGGGTLGDYTLSTATEAWLVYAPDFHYKGGTSTAYHELRFTLAATHWQPWLDGLSVEFAHPTLTDGGGNTYSYRDDDQIYLSAWAERRTPFLSAVAVRFRPPDPAEDTYTFSLTGADGRVLTFLIKLTDWEVTP